MTHATMPQSRQQQRLWFLQRLEPHSCSYNESIVFRLVGILDNDRLQRSAQALLLRHRILRSVFFESDGDLLQCCLGDVTLKVNIIDLSGETRTVRSAAAEAAIHHLNHRIFDLESHLPIRAQLIRLEDTVHVLHISLHHIVTDGWSSSLLIRDLAAFYNADTASSDHAGLPRLTLQYADYAKMQQSRQDGEHLQVAADYWRARLANVPILSLQTDRDRQPVKSGRGASVPIDLPIDLSTSLKQLAKAERATLFMLLLSLFSVVVGRNARQSDIVIGVPDANRGEQELESLIGLFANTLVARTELPEQAPFVEVLRQVKKNWLACLAHRQLSFEKLVQLLRPTRDRKVHPVFQCLFAFQNVPVINDTFIGLGVERMKIPASVSKLDLELYLWDNEQGIEGWLTYDTDLFDASTFADMADDFQELALAVVRNPQQNLRQLQH